jgi:hypothetical protein
VLSNAAGEDVCKVKLTWCNIFGNIGGDEVPCVEDPLSPCSRSDNTSGETIGAYDVN